MKRNHYRIYLHTKYENDFCKELALIAANTNADIVTLDIKRMYELALIAKNATTADYSNTSIYLNEHDHILTIEVMDSNGNWHIGLALHLVTISELEPVKEEY